MKFEKFQHEVDAAWDEFNAKRQAMEQGVADVGQRLDSGRKEARRLQEEYDAALLADDVDSATKLIGVVKLSTDRVAALERKYSEAQKVLSAFAEKELPSVANKIADALEAYGQDAVSAAVENAKEMRDRYLLALESLKETQHRVAYEARRVRAKADQASGSRRIFDAACINRLGKVPRFRWLDFEITGTALPRPASPEPIQLR